MSVYKTGSYLCDQCKRRFDEMVTSDEYRDGDKQVCPYCGHKECSRVISCPNINLTTYPDGKKRFCREKEWSKLNVKCAQENDPAKRKEIKKDMNKVKGVK